MTKNLILLVAVITLSGCLVVGGEVKDTEKNKTVTCVDTRDGETFTFNTNNTKNIKVNILKNTACYDLKDDKGVERHICSVDKTYLKCS